MDGRKEKKNSISIFQEPSAKIKFQFLDPNMKNKSKFQKTA